MALWQLADKEQALVCYERTSEEVTAHAPHDPSIRRFQREAAELMGLPAPPAPTLALPAGAISAAEKLTELQHRRAALDERRAAAPKERWERWQLATDYYQLAVALRGAEQYSDAEAVCREVLETFRTSADEDPQEIQFDDDIGWATHLVADLLVRRRRFEEAVPLARESLARFQSLAEIRPDRPEYRNSIDIASRLLAHLLGELNQFEQAAQAQRESLAAQQAAHELRALPPAQGTIRFGTSFR